MIKIKYLFTALMLLNVNISFSMNLTQNNDKNKNIQLIILICDGHLSSAKKYIEEGDIDPNFVASNGGSANQIACILGHSEIVKLLINAGANRQICSQGLVVSSRYGRTEIVKILIKAGADINFQEWITGLMFAAINNRFYVVKLLIEAGADINIKNEDGKTAFNLIENKNEHFTETKKLLIDRNQELLEELNVAIKKNDNKLMAKLLVLQPSLVDIKGNNFLHIASMMNNYEMVKFIVGSKLSLINKKNNKGNTPLDENPEIILHLMISKRLTLIDNNQESKKRKMEEISDEKN